MPRASTSVRLDKLLVERGLASTRQKAQALILAGLVEVEGRPASKAGLKVSSTSRITVKGPEHPYVSRGGIKLAHALDHFSLDVNGCVAMDVGASTGGFTDCLLQRGARKVYAVDVGYGQLHWKLRNDPRVVVLERQNIRHLPRDLVPDSIRAATIDTSFISLKLVLPKVLPFLEPEALVVALIKPQFEAGREKVGKGGVVRDPAVHQTVCREMVAFATQLNLDVMGVTPSPIQGPKGNREFLMAARWRGASKKSGES